MRFPSILLALALAGCAAAPRAPQSQLTGLIEVPAETSQTIRLSATLRHAVPAEAGGRGGKDQQFYLVAGTYRPYKYNQAGTFYLGEQPAIVERKPAAAGAPATLLRIGGIWIPSDRAAAPRLFYVSDYYKPLADGAPVPAEMRVANLAEFRHQDTPNKRPVTFIYIPVTIPGAIGAITPLQAGLATGAIVGVLALLNEPDAPRELVFATGDIADPDTVRQIRTAFGSAWRYSGS